MKIPPFLPVRVRSWRDFILQSLSFRSRLGQGRKGGLLELCGFAGKFAGKGVPALFSGLGSAGLGTGLLAAAAVCAVIAYWDGLTEMCGCVKDKLQHSASIDEYDDYEE